MNDYSDKTLIAAVIGVVLGVLLCMAAFSIITRNYKSSQVDLCESLRITMLVDLETGDPDDVVAIREIIANSELQCFD
jgi:hypothetical protein